MSASRRLTTSNALAGETLFIGYGRFSHLLVLCSVFILCACVCFVWINAFSKCHKFTSWKLLFISEGICSVIFAQSFTLSSENRSYQENSRLH